MGTGMKMLGKKAMHGGGPVKDTSDGKDLSKNATNSMGKWSNKPVSPNANNVAVKGRK